MILVFDLDDTLYEELSYVSSGFHAVARYLAKRHAKRPAEIYRLMMKDLEHHGRGAIFDAVLRALNGYSALAVAECVAIYRRHTPKISLYPDARRCLRRFAHLPLYIVTDGNANVQARKVAALGLSKLVKKVFISRRYGLKNEKPSPHCFQTICTLEEVPPEKVVYVGDNPRKDFVGIKPLGFKTVRVMRGNYRSEKLATRFEAARSIVTLDQLTDSFLMRL